MVAFTLSRSGQGLIPELNARGAGRTDYHTAPQLLACVHMTRHGQCVVTCTSRFTILNWPECQAMLAFNVVSEQARANAVGNHNMSRFQSVSWQNCQLQEQQKLHTYLYHNKGNRLSLVMTADSVL